MFDYNLLFDEVKRQVSFKQKQLFEEIYKGWRGLTKKSKDDAICMLVSLNPDSIHQMGEMYRQGYLSLDRRIEGKASELYKRILKSKGKVKIHERLCLSKNAKISDMHTGVNDFLLDRIFWSSVNYRLAIRLERNDSSDLRAIAIRSLLKSIEILSECFGLGLYSKYSEEINRLSKQRAEAGRKGAGLRNQYILDIQQYTYALLHERKPRDGKWKNKSVAIRDIESKLRTYILSLQKKDDYVGQRYEDLERTILKWSREDNNLVKVAMEETANIRKSAKK
ncbi:hypothetical protein M0K80_RS15735 [Providencia rettgeri]|nr:hypothetical protein [Providencia rettgeri]EJD6672296.1 hypothetical protein [Providencia rettgeri]ELR5258794.1 hypothetical protein [Providencia rettgeri]